MLKCFLGLPRDKIPQKPQSTVPTFLQHPIPMQFGQFGRIELRPQM